MNKFIKKELEKCRIKLPEYNDDTTYLFIPRNEDVKNLEELKINHFYLFEVADYIINEPPTFTLSASNVFVSVVVPFFFVYLVRKYLYSIKIKKDKTF